MSKYHAVILKFVLSQQTAAMFKALKEALETEVKGKLPQEQVFEFLLNEVIRGATIRANAKAADQVDVASQESGNVLGGQAVVVPPSGERDQAPDLSGGL